VSPAERDAQRRERVIDAAMRLCADGRTTEIPVAVVCRAARVTTRQFYEIFGERGALFTAVYEHAAAVALRYTQDAIADETIPAGVRIRAMMERLFFVDEHSELGRALAVLFVLGATSQELRKRRAVAVSNAAEVLADVLGMSTLDAGVMVSAFVQVLEQSWLGEPLAPTEETVEALIDLFGSRLRP
jgi:AcrR family transcriptional regulator